MGHGRGELCDTTKVQRHANECCPGCRQEINRLETRLAEMSELVQQHAELDEPSACGSCHLPIRPGEDVARYSENDTVRWHLSHEVCISRLNQFVESLAEKLKGG